VIGERWTLLVVRELLLGPKRYKDLLDGLPGIGTNLLAQRLRELEENGLVRRRRLPAPAGVAVYELTEAGRALEDSVLALGRWGAAFLGVPRTTDRYRPGWYVLSMLARHVDVVIETDLAGLLELLSGSLSPLEAVESGRARVEGRTGALERFVDLFGWPPAAAA
jgi:DNA-binding HxlR family transcriptional regulator